jgi:hypothetical protein
LLLTAVAAIAISLLAALPGYAQTVPAPGESPTVDKIKAAGKLRAGVLPPGRVVGAGSSTGGHRRTPISVRRLLRPGVRSMAVRLDVIVAGSRRSS